MKPFRFPLAAFQAWSDAKLHERWPYFFPPARPRIPYIDAAFDWFWTALVLAAALLLPIAAGLDIAGIPR